MQFTEAQQEAINQRNCDLLVSAAAGSGKTAVLAARIVALVKEGMEMKHLLVVTFTKAAAAEMRARILLELSNEAARTGDERLAMQALQVEQADISTLHGFCTKILRTYFEKAGIDPTFRIVEEDKAERLRKKAIELAFEEAFQNPTPAISHLELCMSQEEMENCVYQLQSFLDSQPNPDEWLKEALERYKDEKSTEWWECVRDVYSKKLSIAVKAFEKIDERNYPEPYHTLAEKDLSVVRRIMENMEAGDEIGIAFSAKPRVTKDTDPEIEEEYKSARDKAKTLVTKVLKQYEEIPRGEEEKEDKEIVLFMIEGICELQKKYAEHYKWQKKRLNVLDFSDLEQLALKTLKVPEIRQQVQNKYRQIFVDEYQDSSLLQEEILKSINNGRRLFMVGDVKQSIYRFRLAEPSLFLQKLKTYSKEENKETRRIDLSQNFRTHPQIVEGINQIFEKVLCGGPMEIEYDREARLYPGRKFEFEESPIELLLINKEELSEEEGEELTAEERVKLRQQAEWIAERIQELKEKYGYRNRDFAILMRAVKGGRALTFTETLRVRGIPAYSDDSAELGTMAEIAQMIAILTVIENRRQDEALITALKGIAAGLEDEHLATIRAEHPEGSFFDAVVDFAKGTGDVNRATASFLRRLDRWQQLSNVLSVEALIELILRETDLYAQCGALTDGERRQAALRLFIQTAEGYEGGLAAFLRETKKLIQREGTAPKALGDGDDVARIMTIHKSKGLQFPVVFLAGLETRFNTRESGLLKFHRKLGIASDCIDVNLHSKRKMIGCVAIEQANQMESIAEEARVLYVGMTRAEERLILVGSAGEKDFEKWNEQEEPENASCFLDWIVPIARKSPNFVERKVSAHDTRVEKLITNLKPMTDKLRTNREEINKETEKMLSFVYESRKQTEKKSVTGILKENKEVKKTITMEDLPKRPAFMEERKMTTTEYGDAVHTFLRNIPLDNTINVSVFAKDLEKNGKLSEKEYQSLDLEKLELFVQSPLFERMCNAETVYREMPFNIRANEQNNVMIQGVIDCCFLEDKNWVLLDYKTSGKDDNILKNEYHKQIEMYADALETLTGKKVKEKYLYSVNGAKLIKI